MLLILFCDVMMAAAADEQRDDLVDFSDDPADVTVNYALTASDAPGLAILDSGCTRTMHGSKWSSAVEDALKKYGLERQTKTKLQPFSETVSDTVEVYPVGIGGLTANFTLPRSRVALLCPLLCHVPICRSRSLEPSLTLLTPPFLTRRWALRILP